MANNNWCTWCGKMMGNSTNKSADGSFVHKKCQDDFKSYFKKSIKKGSIRGGEKER